MANSWFQFKQFTVHQQFSAMKVTTDACLFGAMLPRFQDDGTGIRFLDIGAGTGLLSLMAAQLNPKATIVGVEIDEETAKEAAQNVGMSPFKNQISIIHTDALYYKPEIKFDHIISNPPFYEDQLNSPQSKKNIAHHEAGLSLKNLVPIIKKNLMQPFGRASILIPHYREEELISLYSHEKLYPFLIVRAKQSPKHPFFRSMIYFGQKKGKPFQTVITIRDANNQYTPEFIGLLRPFYLNL